MPAININEVIRFPRKSRRALSRANWQIARAASNAIKKLTAHARSRRFNKFLRLQEPLQLI